MARRSRGKSQEREQAKAALLSQAAQEAEASDDDEGLWADSEENAVREPTTKLDIERQLRARRRLEQYQEERRLRRLIEDEWWGGSDE